MEKHVYIGLDRIVSKKKLIDKFAVNGVANEKEEKKFNRKLKDYIMEREEIPVDESSQLKKELKKEPSQKKYSLEEFNRDLMLYKEKREKIEKRYQVFNYFVNRPIESAKKDKSDLTSVLWDTIVRNRDNKKFDKIIEEDIYKKNTKLKKWFKLMKRELKEIAKDHKDEINKCLEKYEIFFNKILFNKLII